MCTALANTYISAIQTIFLGVVSIAQLVEVTDSAVLGGVAEVVSSNPRWVVKYFSALTTGIVDLYIYIYCQSVIDQSLICCKRLIIESLD